MLEKACRNEEIEAYFVMLDTVMILYVKQHTDTAVISWVIRNQLDQNQQVPRLDLLAGAFEPSISPTDQVFFLLFLKRFFDFCLKFIVLMYKYSVTFFLCIFPRSWPLAISSTFRLRHCCSVLQALGWWMQLIWIVRQVYREGGYRPDVHAFGSPYWGMQIRMIYSGRLWIHR